MNLPTLLVDAIAKWKFVVAVLGVLLLYSGVIYYAGYNKADNKWRAAISASTTVEVRRDTVFVAQDANSGTFSAQALVDAKARKKIAEVVRQANELVGVYATENDSLRAINANLTLQLETALEPKLIHLSTVELGDLILKYYPADSTANVYQYQPPPVKTVTIYQERLVLEPQSIWTTMGHVAIGVATGVVVGYAVTHR